MLKPALAHIFRTPIEKDTAGPEAHGTFLCPGCVHRRPITTGSLRSVKICNYFFDTGELRNIPVMDCYFNSVHYSENPKDIGSVDFTDCEIE